MEGTQIYMITRADFEEAIREVIRDEIKRKEQEKNLGVLSEKVVNLPLSVRLINCLRNFMEWKEPETIFSDVRLADITKYHLGDLMRARNFGKKSFKEFEDYLQKYGLKMEGRV